MTGTIDQDNLVYLARGAEHTGAAPDINEAERIAWIPLDQTRDLITGGQIVGAGSVTGLLAVLLQQATSCRGALNGFIVKVLEKHIREDLIDPTLPRTDPKAHAAEELVEILQSYLS